VYGNILLFKTIKKPFLTIPLFETIL